MSMRVALASMCAVAAIGVSLAFATMTSSGSAALSDQARIEAPAVAPIDPFQLMMNSNDLPAVHYDDYSLVFPGR